MRLLSIFLSETIKNPSFLVLFAHHHCFTGLLACLNSISYLSRPVLEHTFVNAYETGKQLLVLQMKSYVADHEEGMHWEAHELQAPVIKLLCLCGIFLRPT
jgi:hypothetical protein